MGSDKAFIQLAGETLVERALRLAREVAPSRVCVVGEARKFEGFAPVIEDAFPGCGPLGGIHAALAKSRTELNLMLAVDLPLVSADLLRFIVEQARASRAVVTVPRSDGRLQPLCAVYRAKFKEIAEQSLKHGKNKIDALFGNCETRVIEDGELSDAGFSPEMFRNVNTPQDLAELRRMTQHRN